MVKFMMTPNQRSSSKFKDTLRNPIGENINNRGDWTVWIFVTVTSVTLPSFSKFDYKYNLCNFAFNFLLLSSLNQTLMGNL